MSDHKACTGVITGMKQMKVSGALRVEIDFEPEMANVAHERLGGFLKPGESRWVGLAVLQKPEEAGV